MKTVISARNVLLVVIFTQLLACSSARLLPPPPQSELIAVEFSGESLSTLFDMPAGVHQIPDSHVIISGHQETRSIESILGPSGFDLETRINTEIGDALTLKLTEPAREVVRELIADPVLSQSFTYLPSDDAPYLEVKTGLVLTLQNEELIKPFIVLHAALMFGGTNFIHWQGRYIASSGPAKPITGEASWLSDDGQALNATISKSLQKAIEVMMRDVASPYPRRANQLVAVKGYYPYLNTPIQIVGYHLDEDDTYLTFLPKLSSAMIFGGVNIVDKETVEFHPATANDEVYQIIDQEVGQTDSPATE